MGNNGDIAQVHFRVFADGPSRPGGRDIAGSLRCSKATAPARSSRGILSVYRDINDRCVSFASTGEREMNSKLTDSAVAAPAPRGVGVLLSVVGAFFCAVALGWVPAPAESFNAPREIVLCAGLLFALGGFCVALNGLAPVWLMKLLGACLWTAFAAIPTWIAWGAGPRNFSGDGLWLLALVGLDFQSLGRTIFGLSALLLWFCAALAWRAWLSGMPLASRIPALLGIAAVAVWLGWGRYLEPAAAQGETEPHRLARYIVDKHANADFSANDQNQFLQPREELWIKKSRARLAATRTAPKGAKVADVPEAQSAPNIDGMIDPSEWRNARIFTATDGRGGRVRVMRHGGKLYVAGEAFSDGTQAGFDQMRVYVHIDLTPALTNERVFVSGSGGATSLRSVRLPGAKHEKTEWDILSDIRGASAVNRHRQFELAIDIEEAGLPKGGVFPFFVDIEGDPIRTATGKFKTRLIEGRVGTLQTPVWLRLPG
jgi:hypothetical protein